MKISYDRGDSFTFGRDAFGLVLESGKALLISGGGRIGYNVTVGTIPTDTTPLSEKADPPYEIKLAFQAVQAVLEAN